MLKWGVAAAALILSVYPASVMAKNAGILDYSRQLREERQEMLEKAQKASSVTKTEAKKQVARPATTVETTQKSAPQKIAKPVAEPSKKTPQKEVKLIPDRGVQTQPHMGVTPPKDAEIKKSIEEAQKKARQDREREKRKEREKAEHRPIKPQPPHKEPRHHHKPAPKTVVRNYYVVSPVTQVSTGGSAVIYEANPHIYTPNAYHCYYKNDLKYCTDYKGKALTGRIVQNYEDSVAYENYRNGYLNGETSVYTLDGRLWQITHYSKGIKHGKETVYFANGRVNYTLNYSKGKINGEVKQYDENGALLGNMRYSNGHYKYRYCRTDVADAALRERVKANMFNDLVLCVNY